MNVQSCEVNCVPLSEDMLSGVPKRAIQLRPEYNWCIAEGNSFWQWENSQL